MNFTHKYIQYFDTFIGLHFVNTQIRINNRSSDFHQKEQNCINHTFIIVYTALSDTFPPRKASVLTSCWWQLNLLLPDLYIWWLKEFSQTSLHCGIFHSFLFHYLLVLAASGHVHTALGPLVLNLWVEGKLARWAREVLQEVIPMWEGWQLTLQRCDCKQ